MSCDIISNLKFVGRDSFDCEHDPKYRRPYRVNPDVAEAQRFYAAQDDAAYLITADTRCELYVEDLEDLEALDAECFDMSETLEEVAAADRYERCDGDYQPLHRMRPKKLRFVWEFLVTRQVTEADIAEETHQIRVHYPRISLEEARIQAFQNLRRSPPKMWRTEERIEVVYVRARPVQEAKDREELNEARQSGRTKHSKKREADGKRQHMRMCPTSRGRKPIDRFTRVSLNRGQTEHRDSLKARRIGNLIEEIKRERKLRQTLRLENAA